MNAFSQNDSVLLMGGGLFFLGEIGQYSLSKTHGYVMVHTNFCAGSQRFTYFFSVHTYWKSDMGKDSYSYGYVVI